MRHSKFSMSKKWATYDESFGGYLCINPSPQKSVTNPKIQVFMQICIAFHFKRIGILHAGKIGCFLSPICILNTWSSHKGVPRIEPCFDEAFLSSLHLNIAAWRFIMFCIVMHCTKYQKSKLIQIQRFLFVHNHFLLKFFYIEQQLGWKFEYLVPVMLMMIFFHFFLISKYS